MRTVRRFHIQETGVLYPSENGMVCYYMDVERLEAKCAELEAKCAELLEALRLFITLYGTDDVTAWQYIRDKAVSAIAKAKGEQL